MSLRSANPISFSPSGVTDTLDGTNAPPGSMQALINIIPDPTTSNLFTCRPGAEELTDFTGFSSPGFISVFFVSGSLVYGMIATATTPGYDQPFCYDVATDAFHTVTGTQDATTLPLSPSTSGDWTPPTMDLIGVQLIVTHPGFPGGAGAFFGWFDVTVPAAPVWHAGNTTVHPLTAVPVAVAQYSSRAWFAVDNMLVFSDALAATVVTNAAQVLTLGDNRDVTALAGFPLNSALTGGITQALIAFKGASIMYQITGDSATSDLSINAFTTATGTLAPNAIQQTPKGLAFISPQGVRLLTTQMVVTEPVGAAGTGVSVPFIYTVTPSRMCAAYNADIYRASVQNGLAATSDLQDWWYDGVRNCWTGPHTFPASFIRGYIDATNVASFIMAPEGITGKLFNSRPVPPLTSIYTENGAQMSFTWTTSILPDTDQMSESYLTESTIKMSLPENIGLVTVSALNEDMTVLQAVTLAPAGPATVWGAFVWGVGLWLGTASSYKPRRIPWEEQPTFRMVQFSITGDSVDDFHIGTMQNRYQISGYLQQ